MDTQVFRLRWGRFSKEFRMQDFVVDIRNATNGKEIYLVLYVYDFFPFTLRMVQIVHKLKSAVIEYFGLGNQGSVVQDVCQII